MVGLEVAAEAYCDLASPRRRLLLEAFLIHARNLREFFWSTPKPRFAHNDVFAEHYCERSREYRGAVPATLDRTWGAIDWQLVHITRARAAATRTENLDEAVPLLTAELQQAWTRFLNRLEPAWRDRFQAEYDRWQAQPW
jgi:hypothetical protein